MGKLHPARIFARVDAGAVAFSERSQINSQEAGNCARSGKSSTDIQHLNKQTPMKNAFILCCVALVAVTPVCFGQEKPPKAGKSAANESAITDLEKSAWEAYKNKQADAFKALMSKDYFGVYADGVKNLDAELADMAKTDLRDYSFSDVKVVFPRPKVAVVTYKTTVQATSDGKDVSGTYNCGSVWVEKGKKWIGALHSESKTQ
jgi:hypothetical protein